MTKRTRHPKSASNVSSLKNITAISRSGTTFSHAGHGLLLFCSVTVLIWLISGFFGPANATGFSVLAAGTWPACDHGNPSACGSDCVLSDTFKFEGTGLVTLDVVVSPYQDAVPLYQQNILYSQLSNIGWWFDGNDGSVTSLWSSSSGNPTSGAVYRSTGKSKVSNTTGTVEKRLVACPQRSYGSLWGWWQSASTNYVRMDFEPRPDNASTLWEHPEQLGGTRDNQNTHYHPLPICGLGLPTYSVNTSFLNLVIEDTEFSCQTLGQDLAMRRVWNMQPGRSGMFGNGWSFEYESEVTQGPGLTGMVKLTQGSGQTLEYVYQRSQVIDPETTRIEYLRFTPGAGPVLTADINNASGIGEYRLFDQQGKTTHVYEYASTVAGVRTYRLSRIEDRNANTINLVYDGAGRLVTITDAAGRQTRFVYNAQNRVVRMDTLDGRSASYEYDAVGNLVSNVDLLGTVINYTYDALTYPLSMSVDGKITHFTYATKGTGERYLASVTEPDGQTIAYAFDRGIPVNGGGWREAHVITEPGGTITRYYDRNGRTDIIDAPRGKTLITYNSLYLPDSVTDTKGRIARLEYDETGNLTKYTDTLGNVTGLAYDDDGNLISLTDALGQITRYSYDDRHNLIATTSPLGHTTELTVNDEGLVTQVVLPEGQRYALGYDSAGNLTSLTDPLGQTLRIDFDAPRLNPRQASDPRGNTTGFDFDANRRLTAVHRADGASALIEHDCCAMTAIADGAGEITEYQRDAVSRLTAILDPLGQRTAFTYNADGDLTGVTDPLGRTTQLSYDPDHLPNRLTDALSGQVRLARDAMGNLTRLTDEVGNATDFAYDAGDRLVSITDPLGQVTADYAYDALGQLTQITNGRGGRVGLTYDADGRVTGKAYDGTTVASYAWNDSDGLIQVTDATGTKRFTYDATGQASSIIYPDGRRAGFEYDTAGNISTLTYPDGLGVQYDYDALNRVTEVRFAGQSIRLEYDATGRLTGETRSNGVHSLYEHDPVGRVTRIAHQRGATAIVDLQYVRNEAGLIVSEHGVRPLHTPITAGAVTSDYDAANTILNANDDHFTHDADGNLIEISGSRRFTAEYDPENRPSSVTRSGSLTHYDYDGIGNRVQGRSATVTRKFYHDTSGRLLADIDVTNNIVTHYLYAGARLIASGGPGRGYVFHHFNQIGSTLALTNSTGNVVGAFAYDPFGRVVARSGNVSTAMTFVGAYGVIESGGDLFFMRHRYYDATTGRFIQRDPIGFAGGQTNLYSYAANNPVSFVDPDGQMFTPVEWVAGGAALVSWAYVLYKGYQVGNHFPLKEQAHSMNQLVSNSDLCQDDKQRLANSQTKKGPRATINATAQLHTLVIGLIGAQTGNKPVEILYGLVKKFLVTDNLEKQFESPYGDSNAEQALDVIQIIFDQYLQP
jgi:RHS repeat-associated protein